MFSVFTIHTDPLAVFEIHTTHKARLVARTCPENVERDHFAFLSASSNALIFSCALLAIRKCVSLADFMIGILSSSAAASRWRRLSAINR